jgi:quercetin dioxygenase-like cupin family protein
MTSRIYKTHGDYRWKDIPIQGYGKADAAVCGVNRQVLAGANQEDINFEVRYFELEPDGYSQHEKHSHAHSIFVLKGKGQLLLGKEIHQLDTHDVAYVAPFEEHQLRNPNNEVMGFICVVNKEKGEATVLSR